MLAASYGDYRFREFTDADGTQHNGNRVPGIPSWQLGSTLRWQPQDDWSGTIDARWVGKRYADNANQSYADSYLTVDARMVRRWSWGDQSLRLTVGVENLFDARYEDDVRINAAGGRYFEPAPERSLFANLYVEHSLF